MTKTANPFDEFDATTAKEANPFDEFDEPKRPRDGRTIAAAAGDVGAALLKGAVGLPAAVVGLADIPTGGRVGKALEEVGYRPGDAKAIIDDWYSTEQKAANAAVQNADGFVDTLRAGVANPSAVAGAAIESLPQMLGGAGVARGVLKVAPKVAPWLAAAGGEGVLAAGAAADEARGKSADGLLSDRQALAALGAGAGTAAFGAAGGRLAQRMGLGDVDTMLAAGTSKLSKAPPGFVRQVVGAGISEGVFEELPQSIQEKMWENWGAGRPLGEGVGNAAAMGLMTGAAMGVAGGGVSAVGNRGGQLQAQPQPAGDAGAAVPAAAPAAGVAGAPAGSPDGLAAAGSPAAPAAPAGPNAGAADASIAPVVVDRSAAASSDPTGGPSAAQADARLAELEVTATSRPLTPAEQTEYRRLTVEIDGAETAPDAAPARPAGIAPGRSSSAIDQPTLPPGARVASTSQPSDPSAGQPWSAAPDPALQNRDRTRAASVAQMSEIARKPDYARLGISRTPEAGAPMVFAVGDDVAKIPAANLGRPDIAVMSDGQRVPFRYAVVDASLVEPSNFADGAINQAFNSTDPGTLKALNNGRTAGVRAAYELGSAGGYQAELLADAAAHGVAPEAVQRTRNPMLVRVYSERSNTADMAAKSQGQALGLSAPEQARQDSGLIDPSVLAVYVPGEITSAGNRDFVRAFVGRARQAGLDVATLMADDGSLSATGRQRIQAALLQAAYADADLVAEMFESTDSDMRTIGEALKSVAGEWAGMRESARQLAINPEADITDNLLQAVQLVRKSRRERIGLWDLIQQPDLLTGEVPDPLTVGLVRIFYPSHYFTRPAGRERVIEALRDYVRGAQATTATADLLGQTVSAGEILAVITQPTNGDRDAQAPTPQSRRVADGGRDPVSGADEAGQGNRQQQPGRDGQGTGGDGAPGPGPGREAGGARAALPAGAAAGGLNSERFPSIATITGLSVGPGGRITPQPIAPGRLLYREMDVPALDDLLRLDGQADVRAMFVTDNPELAIGQGSNRGVLVTFRPDSLSGREHLKPMTGDRAGREYRTDLVAPRAVQSIEINDAAIKNLRGLTRRALKDFVREPLPGGRVRLHRRGLPGSPAAALESRRSDAVDRAKDALADVTQIMTAGTRATMLPEDTPGLMPALVKLFDAAVDIVGTDLQRATAWVREQLRADPRTRAIWNRIAATTLRKAAEQTLAKRGTVGGAQAGLFDEDDLPALATAPVERSAQGDLLAPPSFEATAAAASTAPASGWVAFAPDTGTLGIPRADMPQISGVHRGALVNFLTARGIAHEQDEVPAGSLKPTQAEYSPRKVKTAAGNDDRSILVSADGHVLDGHHQWLAKMAAGEPVGVIRFNAPIERLLMLAHRFPSSTAAGDARVSAPAATGSPVQAKITDAGEKIGGARKDWRERGLTTADLDSMSESEGAQLATKANTWKPDYAAMVADGGDPSSAAMVKVVYDALAAKPKTNTPQGRRDYVRAMQAVREVYGAVRTIEQAKTAYLRIRAALGVTGSGMQQAEDQEAARRVLFAVYKGRSDPFVFGHNELVRARKLVVDGFPGAIEPWTRRFVVRAIGGDGLTPRGVEIYVAEAEKLGTPLTPEQLRAGAWRVIDKAGKVQAYATTKVDAEAAARSIYDRLRAGGDLLQDPERPHLDRLIRQGLEAGLDRDVTADDFIADFGFRGVEFGNWAAQDERQKILNLAYDALSDLARVLKLPPRALSLNGTMGMAFGARGGGKFAAHYEPGKLVINMTKLRGAGSLAHEWAHGFDHYLGELDRADAYQALPRGASGWYDQAPYDGRPHKRMVKGPDGRWTPTEQRRLGNLRPELAEKIDAVMRALYTGQQSKADMLKEMDASIQRAEGYASKTEGDDALKAMYRRQAENYRAARAEIAVDPDGTTYPKGRSQFAAEAQKLTGKSSKGYWLRPTEMFARAFEAYTFDRLVAQGGQSDYLVHGVEAERYAGENYRGNPYPTGGERVAINKAFDALVATLRTRESGDGKLAIFEPEATYGVVQAEREVYAVTEPGATRDVPLDLFPDTLDGLQSVPGAAGGPVRGPRSGRSSPGDVRPAAGVSRGPVEPNTLAVRADPDFPGIYHYSTQLVEVGQRELPVSRVTTWDEAASAMQALRRYAVEHFDVLVTDKNGMPLAVVGAFKGAQSQAAVYPATLLQEALRIQGAARLWGVHNHPSGLESLSRADEHLSGAIARTFDPSSLEWMGLAAVGDGRFQAVHGKTGDIVSGALVQGDSKSVVPVVERTIARANQGMPVVSSPQEARRVVVQAAGGQPGIVFVDAQHRLTAWVPMNPSEVGALRLDGRFDRLINSAASAGASGALIANPGGVITARALQNLVNALGLADIRVLDAIDTTTGASAAERGVLPSTGGTVMSRAGAPSTPAFKAWFGTSKVVDTNGAPKVMFHGTGADITAFKAKQAGAIFLTEEPIFAQAYADSSAKWLQTRGRDGAANILPVYVKAERPFDYDNPAHRRQVIDAILSGPDAMVRPDGKAAVKGMNGAPTLWDAAVLEGQLTDPAGTGNWTLIEEPWFQRALRRLGFDGFYVSEGSFKNLGVYEPTQIKSAIGNRGTYDPTTPDIRFSDPRGAAGAAAGGISMADLFEVSGRIASALPGLPKVNVFLSPKHLGDDGAPGRLRALIEERGAMDDAEGALHEGEIYLFASGIADAERAEHVLAEHEAAHAGLRGLLGGELHRSMRAIANENPAVRKAAVALMKLDPSLSLIEAVEEVIVDMPSAQLVKLQGWRALVGKVRNWLKDHGFVRIAARLDAWLKGSLADQQRADLFVADLVREARAFVAGNAVPASAAGAAPPMPGARSGAALAPGRQQWLDREARPRGFKDFNDLAAKDPALATKVAALWERRAAKDSPAVASASTTTTAAPAAGSNVPMSATARAVFSRNARRGETADGRPLPDPDPDDGNPWRRAKAKVMALTDPKALDRLVYEFQDKFVDLRRLRDRLAAGGGVITDLNDAYLGEELYHRRLSTRTDDFLREELKPLLEDLKARAVAMADFERYLHARHAPEANAVLAERNPNAAQLEQLRADARKSAGDLATKLEAAQRKGTATKAIEEALAQARAEASRLTMVQAFKGTEAERLSLSGLSDDEAKAHIAGLGPAGRADMEALAAKVDAINASTLKMLEDYGLMSREALDAWRSTYRHYVPLHRDEAHADAHAHPIGTGFSIKGDAARSRVGSNAKVTHILGHLAMQREAALTRGEKNLVIKKLYLLAAQNPDPGFWSVERLPTIKTLDPATGFVRTGVDPRYKNLPNVVMLRIAGRDVAITFNERNPQALRLAEAMKNLDVGDLHVVLGLAAKGTRWFASVNTQYNPIFGLVNFARDVQAGLLNLSTTELAGEQRQVTANALKAMRAIYRAERGKNPTDQAWTRLWRELQEVGGTTGYRDLFTDAADRVKALEKQLAGLDRGKTSQAAHAIVDWLSDFNETMENAVRLSAYTAALDKGMTKERAASLAKNLTVNFNRKGRQAREIGALYAFFNAAIQGTTRMAETLRGPLGQRIMYGGVALGALNTLLGMAVMGGGDDDSPWERIPPFVKERSIIIPLGREDYATIPLPLGFHVFPNIGRVAVEMAFGPNDKTAGRRLGELLMTLTDAFNPLGGAQNLGQMVSPTVIDPVVALMQNKDWTGRPIYREPSNPLDPQPGHAMAKDSASTVGRGLAKAINTVTGGTEYRPGGWSPTPDQIDYLMGQLTGGLGRELLKANQTLAAPFTGDELPAHKVPLLGRLYGNTRGGAGHSGAYFENVKLLNELENEVDGLKRSGQDVQAFREAEPLTRLIGRGNVVEARVKELRQQRRAVAERADEGFREQLRELDERIAEVMASFNAEVARARRSPAVSD